MTVVVITEANTEKDLTAAFPAPGNDWVLVRTVAEAGAPSGAAPYNNPAIFHEAGRGGLFRPLVSSPAFVDVLGAPLPGVRDSFIPINPWSRLPRPVRPRA